MGPKCIDYEIENQVVNQLWRELPCNEDDDDTLKARLSLTSIEPVLSASETMKFDCEVKFDPSVLNLITSRAGLSFSMECKGSCEIQKRRHKKKRINKKWAKRYGYITRLKDFKFRDVSLVSIDYADGLCEAEYVTPMYIF